MKLLDPVDQVVFSNLVARSHDVHFVDQFSEKGSFVKLTRGDRQYWYHKILEPRADGPAKPAVQYVGPADDPEINGRVENWKSLKDDYRTRRNWASRLRRAGLPAAQSLEARVIDDLAKHGLFRLRAILVGSHAFQTYSGLLGVRMENALHRTEDVDIAQDYGISVFLDDAMDDFGEILFGVDETFAPQVDPDDPSYVAGYRNRDGMKIEVLTTNRGASELGSKLSCMDALGGVGAQPLPFLDFLIRDPVRSVLLHEAGVGVVVPSPERFAVHKIIVSERRRGLADGRSKILKDRAQASSLVEAMTLVGSGVDLGEAWMEAWERGPQWRRTMSRGVINLPQPIFDKLERAVVDAARMAGGDVAAFGLGQGKDGVVALWQDKQPRGPGR